MSEDAEPFEEEGPEPPEDFGPLDPEEREDVEADLEDLEAIRSTFQPQGTKGVVIACPDCGSNHYYGWDLLKESLQHMLETGEPRMHEPAFEPKEDDYILWDYGKGYIDALADVGLEEGSRVELESCPWCKAEVQAHFAFCSTCGKELAPARLVAELISRGINEREARALLVKAGFEPFG